jgi:hypothetical protein
MSKQTKRGRSMGRGFKHLFDEATKVENVNDQIADPYAEAAVRVLGKNAKAEQSDLIYRLRVLQMLFPIRPYRRRVFAPI